MLLHASDSCVVPLAAACSPSFLDARKGIQLPTGLDGLRCRDVRVLFLSRHAGDHFPGSRPSARLRRAEYERLAGEGFFRGERVELIQGIVVEMSPVGPAHANPLDLLVETLVPALVGRARVRIRQPFVVADDSEPEPDLAVVPPGQYADRHADNAYLVVEVAETSLAYDRDTKASLYAAAGVGEYWIVDVNARCVEAFGQPSSGQYTRSRRAEADVELAVTGFSDVKVRVSELFATCSGWLKRLPQFQACFPRRGASLWRKSRQRHDLEKAIS